MTFKRSQQIWTMPTTKSKKQTSRQHNKTQEMTNVSLTLYQRNSPKLTPGGICFPVYFLHDTKHHRIIVSGIHDPALVILDDATCNFLETVKPLVDWCEGPMAFNSKRQIVMGQYKTHKVVVLDENLQVVTCFGKEGTERGEFHSITGIVVDNEDNIFVVDGNHRIQIFRSDYTLMNEINLQTCRSDSALPNMVIYNDRLYVHECGSKSIIQVFTLDGQFIHFLQDHSGIRSMVITPKGQVIAACMRDHTISVLDVSNGSLIAKFTSNSIKENVPYSPIGLCLIPYSMSSNFYRLILGQFSMSGFREPITPLLLYIRPSNAWIYTPSASMCDVTIISSK
jgi:DNA-binding beta-propeller fold protein YncE